MLITLLLLCFFPGSMVQNGPVTITPNKTSAVHPAPAVSAGPFGFEYGMTKEAIVAKLGPKAISRTQSDILVLNTAPSPHPDFENYILMFSQNGLVKVAAFTKPIETNRSGEQLKEKYSKLCTSLKAKYGISPVMEVDRLNPGSLWSEDNEWMMSMLKKERTVEIIWDKDSLQHALSVPARLNIVAIEAVATGPTSGYISLSYEFDGFDEYIAQKKAKQDSVF